MKLGDRINTKLGWGTVVGFENINVRANKCSIQSTPDDEGGRVVVALDDQSKWPWGRDFDQYHPYMCASDLLLPMAAPRVQRPAPTLPPPKPLPQADHIIEQEMEDYFTAMRFRLAVCILIATAILYYVT